MQYNKLIEEGNFDHRPFLGMKFLGHRYSNGKYSFHGYNDLDGKQSAEKNFKESVEEKFRKINDQLQA